MTNLGERIQSVRKKLGFTQDEMASHLGVSGGNTVSNYEKNLREPDISTLIKIAELGSVSLDWLLKFDSGPAPADSKSLIAGFTIAKSEIPAPREYQVLSQIAAGKGNTKLQVDPEWKSLDFDPREHFWLKVDEEYGFSMRPFLRPKEMVLCAYTTKKFYDEDMVAVLWDKTKGAVKILNLNHNLKDIVVLDSLNPSERSITLKKSQILAMYKVVLIAKI